MSSPRVAIVTGASRGIGRAIATRLAQEGCTVVVNYTRSHEDALALADQLGGLAVRADMSVVAEVRSLFDTAAREYGRLDVLINNAGIAEFHPLSEVGEDEFERVFAVNTRGVFFAMQEAARRMKEGGRIVNISTGATTVGPIGSAVYCGSKAAIEQFTRVAARELGPRGITVNTVSPGFTDTDMLNANPNLVSIGPGMSALGRLGTPEDIADIVAFLCSEKGRWLTGQNLQAGGGASMV